MRAILLGCLAVLCTACTRPANDTHADSTPKVRSAHPAVNVPHYWSEAQRNRAEHYWLPQNLLPPDAAVGPEDDNG